MLSEKFIILAVLISVFGGLNYLISTVKGRTKPNRVTWFLWALAPMIAFGAELNEGVGMRSLVTFMVGFNPMLIFVASFVNKKSVWKVTNFDYMCGVISIIGIVVWLITRTNSIAILFAIIADAAAAIPTIIKSYKFPETESYIGYLTGIISTGIGLLVLDEWGFSHWAFPAYIILVNSLLILLIKGKVGIQTRAS